MKILRISTLSLSDIPKPIRLSKNMKAALEIVQKLNRLPKGKALAIKMDVVRPYSKYALGRQLQLVGANVRLVPDKANSTMFIVPKQQRRRVAKQK
jgi:hypothetical protein